MRPRELQGDGIAVNIGDQPKLHRGASVVALFVGGAARADNSAERLVAASTASINAPRTPARSSACSPAIVVPPGEAT